MSFADRRSCCICPLSCFEILYKASSLVFNDIPPRCHRNDFLSKLYSALGGQELQSSAFRVRHYPRQVEKVKSIMWALCGAFLARKSYLMVGNIGARLRCLFGLPILPPIVSTTYAADTTYHMGSSHLASSPALLVDTCFPSSLNPYKPFPNPLFCRICSFCGGGVRVECRKNPKTSPAGQ